MMVIDNMLELIRPERCVMDDLAQLHPEIWTKSVLFLSIQDNSLEYINSDYSKERGDLLLIIFYHKHHPSP